MTVVFTIDETQCIIRIHEPSPSGVIVSTSQVIEACFLVEYIPPVAEGVELSEGILLGTCRGDGLAPGVVPVLYNQRAGVVKQTHNVALETVDIAVPVGAELDHGRLALGVVEEVEGIAALGHVHDLLAVEVIVGGGRDAADGGGLLRAQAVVVVREAHGCAGFAHGGQLASRLPGIAPRAVICGIANGVKSYYTLLLELLVTSC